MDGVAVSAKETFGATETTPVTLKPDQFLVLDTGDPIPEDKDAVIMVEDIVKNGDGSITIHAAAAPWQHIRQIGEDVWRRGNDFAQPYDRFPSCHWCDDCRAVCWKLKCSQTWWWASSPQGTRLSRPVQTRSPGIFWNFNGSIFSAMVRSWGGRGGGLSHCTG